MSNLPHGLGSAVAGQLFYPGAPHVTAYDVAGAHGSRAVEFGEDGVSSATNRLGYALAKNDEYQQARLEAPIATPRYVNWTPTSGSGDRYVFSGVNLFVGDATYLPETQDTRDSLICVLDSAYNEILDVYGNRVVVKSIKNSAETASIVGDPASAGGNEDGFYPSGAVVRFKSVHPVAGYDVLPTVVIPDGTNVVLVYGLGGTLDSLATVGLQYLMRDMLVKGTIRSSTHIAAAVFLRDGSRTMLSNIDMDGHHLNNCQAVRGTGGTPLEINNRVGSGERIMFSDKNVSFATFSNTGCTNPYTPGGFWPSILGVLNSGARMNEKMHGNRVIDKGGALDWQAGYLNIPDMVVALNGEAVTVATQRVPAVGTLPAGGSGVVVVQADGTVINKNVSAVLSTDLLIAYFTYYGGPTFSGKADARWTYNGTSSTFEVTVGAATYHGADFTSLQDACDFVSAISPTQPTGRWIIRILGEVELSAELNLTTYGNYTYMTIMGDTPFTSKIKTSATFPTTSHLIKVNGTGFSSDLNRVSFENLTIQWKNTSAHQSAGYCAISNPGHNTIIRNCLIVGYTYGFSDAIRYVDSGMPTPFGLHLTDCFFTGIRRSIVDDRSRATGIVVENCTAVDCSSSDFAFLLDSNDNKVINSRIWGDVTNHFDHGVKIGHRGEVGGCYFYTNSGSSINISYGTTADLKVDVHNNYLQLVGGYGLSIINSAGNGNISFQNNTVVGGSYGVLIQNGTGYTGMTSIMGNRFDSQANIAIKCLDYGRILNIVDNHFAGQAGNVIDLDDNYTATIAGNVMEGYGSAGINYLIGLNGSGGRASVHDNDFSAANAHALSTMIYINVPEIKFHSNRVYGYTGSGNVAGLVLATEGEGSFVGNQFIQGNDYLLSFRNTTVAGMGRCTISGNVFGYTPRLGIQLYITGFNHMTVDGNTFGRLPVGKVGGNSIVIHKDVLASTYITVNGNTFQNVEGYGSSIDGALVNDDIDNMHCSYSSNVFEKCGFTDNVARWPSAISTRGLYCAVTGNVIRQMLGPIHASGGAAAIILVWGQTVVTGNHVYQDVSSSEHPYGMYAAIWGTDHFCTITGNELYIVGTIGGAGRSVYGIRVGTSGFSWHTIVGNNINYWANTLGVNYAISTGTAEGSVIMGNRCGYQFGGLWYGQDINVGFGADNMVLGNFSASYVTPGSNVTSGNISKGP